MVQSSLVNFISGKLSDKLKTTITVESVDVSFFDKLLINGIYVEDQNGDTLTYVKQIKAAVTDLKFNKNIIYFDKITLNQAKFYLQNDSNDISNLQFILDNLSSEDTTQTASWDFRFASLELNNSSFTYKKHKPDSVNGINFSDLDIRDINILANNFIVKDDTIRFRISEVKLKEKSSFQINNFESNIVISSKSINLESLKLITQNSNIVANNLQFKYKKIAEFKDFINKIKIKSSFDSTKIDFIDIAYFAPTLKGSSQVIYFSGIIKGKIKSLKGRNVKINYGTSSKIKANFSLDGLPNIYETFIFLDVKELITYKKDLEQIQIPPFDKNKKLVLADNISKFGEINYNGNFTGFITDFVAYGNFTTRLGSFSSDISLKSDTAKKTTNFKGNLKTKEFNIGKFTNQDSLLGKVNLNINIDGYSQHDNLIATLEGEINSITVNDYNYKNVDVEGDVENKKFDGNFTLDDENIKMDFLGRFDFNNEVPVFDFTADIEKIKFDNLNFHILNSDSTSELSLLLTANFIGTNIDNIKGSIDLFNVNYKQQDKEISYSEIRLRNDIFDDYKQLSVNSDILDLMLIGKYNLVSLDEALFLTIDKYLPALSIRELSNTNDTNIFSFEIRFRETKPVFNFISLDYDIAENTNLNGEYNSLSHDLTLSAKSKSISIYDNYFSDIKLKLNTTERDSILDIKLDVDYFKNETFYLKNIALNTENKNNKSNIDLSWQNTDTVDYSGNIFALAQFSKNQNNNPKVDFEFLPSDITIADSIWYINDSKISVDSTAINIDKLFFNKENQYIYINGKITDNKQDSLNVILNEINLANLNLLTKESDVYLKGILNGEAYLTDLYNNVKLVSDLNVDNLVINDEEIGQTYFKNSWDNLNKKINVDAYTKRGKIKTISLKGDIYTTADKLDLTLKFNKLKLNIFQAFLQGIASDFRGYANGTVQIKGTTKNPLAEGVLGFQKTSFVIDYLNTKYYFTNNINIAFNKILFSDVEMFDTKGNKAIISGDISHQNYKDFKLNIGIDARNLWVLNTSAKHNELFYGKAFATGLFKISGTPKNIIFDIKAKTNKDTKFYIPLSSGETAESSNFISFVNKSADTVLLAEETYEVDLSGMQLNFDMEVTPDAEVQIIFDSKVGDIIKAKGNGNINMKINTKGNFNMSGDYVIDKGDYLFTLQNIINKRFDVEKGGNIKWNGDPYNAYLDINAIYRTKTSLYNLTLDSTDKKRIPIECKLNMTNSLMNPDIKFSINAPTANDRGKAVIESFTEDESNKQMLSLLVINNFYTPDNLRGTELASNKSSNNAVGVNSSELLSNQLSHWLSQISNDFDIGVNYRPGDEITTDELEVALSTQILNDRVAINGNFGVGGNQESTSNLAGNVDVEVKINKSGKLRLKGYTKSNNDVVYNSSPTTQGMGIFYTEDFDTFGELLRKFWFKKKKDKNN